MQRAADSQRLPLVQQRQPRMAGQVMGVDGVGDGLETEKILSRWAIHQAKIGAGGLAFQGVAQVWLDNPRMAVPFGKTVVEP